MSIFDKFKKSKTEDKKAPAAESDAAPVKAETEDAAIATTPPTPFGADSSDLLVKPLLSEKAMSMAGLGRYVFMVRRWAQKPEIKKSIQKIYNVHVEDVKIINLPAKKRRSGRHVSMTAAHKKAIVILKKGETIPGIIESVG